MRIKSVNTTTHKLKLSLSAAAILALSGCGGSNTNTDIKAVDTSTPVSDWVMVWNDEFEGTNIDTNKWTHEVNCAGGGNQEKQCYTDAAENSFVVDGSLNIVAKPSVNGEALPYTSARMVTKYKGDWTYGRFEMRAKLPEGQGTWPAFWMLSTDEVYGGWPKSGEIDIMEAVNLKAEKADGTPEDRVYGTLHYGRDFPDNESSGGPYTPPSNPADGFHTYSIEWQEGEVRWYMDGYLYATQLASELRTNGAGDVVGLKHRGWFAEYFNIATGVKEVQWNNAPFDQDFHLLLNLAVGGNWPENVNELGIDETAFANGQTFEVDYVRVFECSINPLTGAGCETVRGGYKDEDDALILGKAPTPPPPPSTTPIPITIFGGEENPGWKLWDSSGNTDPELVADDADRGNVAEFKILDNAGAVLGFNSRAEVSEDGVPYNGSAMLANGNFSFDMKVVSPTNGATTWLLKIESDNNNSAVEVALNTSNEGMDPVTGVWQTYTFSMKSLADADLDLSLIDVIMIFPAWQTGEGAVYRIDNVKIEESGGTVFPELVLFEDQANPDWAPWDCCGGTTPTEETDDADHGTVVEFSVLNNAGTVLGFKPADESGISFDASALQTEGVIEFEMKVVTGPTNATSVWKFKTESNGGTGDGNDGQAYEVDLATLNGNAAPVVGQWATYSISIADLFTAGIDVSAIDVVMIFPAWQTGADAVYRVDNAKIYNPNASTGGPTGPTEVVFADQASANWPLWDSDGGTTPTVETDDADRGSVAEFQITNNDGTVLGFNSRLPTDGMPFNASSLLATGTLSFKMKVVNQPTAATSWLLKVEAGGNTSAAEVGLNTSNEGADPVTGAWQTYTFNLSDLSDAGLDISAIDVIMIFPAWQTGEGALYRVDDVVIGNPGSTGGGNGGNGGSNAVLSIFGDAVNSDWALWDSSTSTTPMAVNDADRGSVAQFEINNNAGAVLGFNNRSDQNGGGNPFDATAYESSGTFSFKMKVVSAPTDTSAEWLLKIEDDTGPDNGNPGSAVEMALNTSNEGQDPVVGQWQTYTFDLLTLTNGGLMLDAIDVVMIFPTWQKGDGTVYLVDDVVITE